MQRRHPSRRHPSRGVVVATAVLAAMLFALAMPATSGASTRSRKLSTEACDAFADYFTIEFLVAFAGAFAGFGGDTGTGSQGSKDTSVTAEEIQDIFHLIFSPKLQTVTALLAAESPSSIRTLFAKQQAVFTRGVDLLGELGLTKKQLKALAALDLDPDTDVSEVLGEVDIPRAKLRSAAKEFGKHAGALDLDREVNRSQQRAFQRTGSRCGVFPESRVDCESLVSTDLSAPLVGGDPTVKDDQGSCTFTGPAQANGDEPVMIVDVYPTPRTFERFVDQLQDPQRIDADTYVADGFSSFASTKTCGKTLYSSTGGDSIVVALCPPDGSEVTPADLVAVRDAAADALAS